MWRIAGFFVLVNVCFSQRFADDAIYTVNSLKALHSVSEKFISISIDPAVLLTGLNLSDSSLELAKHLSPSYIRIAGPSTPYVKYEEYDAPENEHSSDSIILTPSMWFGINEWLTMANLTPIFGINDITTSDSDRWDPKSIQALLEISDKLNITCLWQLGFDCSNKTELQYRNDLKALHKIIEDYPDKKASWKIIGSDLSQCLSNKHPETIRRALDDLQNTISAVMWETPNVIESIRLRTPVWTVAPKDPNQITFDSALSWAMQLGEAARAGFEVIFRQPRLHELSEDTPAYWVSILHKNIMGRTVLDVKGPNSDGVAVFAHCAKHQNEFVRSGAVSIFLVNNGTRNGTVMFKFGSGALLKNTEVQSYVLTAPSDDSTDVYVNDERLTLANFTAGAKLTIAPKLRYARIMNYLSLSLPPKSMGFFVLPGIQMSICQAKEADIDEVLDEIRHDQTIPFRAEPLHEIEPRLGAWKKANLKSLQKEMEQELAADKRYYQKMRHAKPLPYKPITKAQEHVNEAREDVRNFFIGRAKMAEKQRKQIDGGLRMPLPKATPAPRELELELTSAEIKKILADRAKIKAARKHVMFTSGELEEIMNRATERILKNKNTLITIRRKAKRDVNMGLLKQRNAASRENAKKRHEEKKTAWTQRLKKAGQKREKRDINLDLLKIKTELNQRKSTHDAQFDNNDEKMATIRRSGEIFEQLHESEKKKAETVDDVFAELASSAEEDSLFGSSTAKPKKVFTAKPGLFAPKVPKADPKFPKAMKPDVVRPGQERNEDFSLELDDGPLNFDEEYDCIHEFGLKAHQPTVKPTVSELFEASGEVAEDTDGNHLPELAARGFEPLYDDDSSPSLKLDAYLKKHDLDDYLDTGEDTRRRRATGRDVLKERFAFRKQLDSMNRQRMLAEGKERFSRYKPLSEGFREWKAADVLTFKKKGSPKKVRKERSAGGDISSLENEIDGFMNQIGKDAEVVKRNFKAENGDYELIFPNSDKIEVLGKNGKTEVKIEFNDGRNKTGNLTSAGKSNVQKIALRDVEDVWKQLFGQFTTFFQGLGHKLKKCIFEDLLK